MSIDKEKTHIENRKLVFLRRFILYIAWFFATFFLGLVLSDLVLKS